MGVVFWITVVLLEVFVSLAVLLVWRFTFSHRLGIAGRQFEVSAGSVVAVLWPILSATTVAIALLASRMLRGQ
jgi:hypothetical protein